MSKATDLCDAIVEAFNATLERNPNGGAARFDPDVEGRLDSALRAVLPPMLSALRKRYFVDDLFRSYLAMWAVTATPENVEPIAAILMDRANSLDAADWLRPSRDAFIEAADMVGARYGQHWRLVFLLRSALAADPGYDETALGDRPTLAIAVRHMRRCPVGRALPDDKARAVEAGIVKRLLFAERMLAGEAKTSPALALAALCRGGGAELADLGGSRDPLKAAAALMDGISRSRTRDEIRDAGGSLPLPLANIELLMGLTVDGWALVASALRRIYENDLPARAVPADALNTAAVGAFDDPSRQALSRQLAGIVAEHGVTAGGDGYLCDGNVGEVERIALRRVDRNPLLSALADIVAAYVLDTAAIEAAASALMAAAPAEEAPEPFRAPSVEKAEAGFKRFLKKAAAGALSATELSQRLGKWLRRAYPGILPSACDRFLALVLDGGAALKGKEPSEAAREADEEAARLAFELAAGADGEWARPLQGELAGLVAEIFGGRWAAMMGSPCSFGDPFDDLMAHRTLSALKSGSIPEGGKARGRFLAFLHNTLSTMLRRLALVLDGDPAIDCPHRREFESVMQKPFGSYDTSHSAPACIGADVPPMQAAISTLASLPPGKGGAAFAEALLRPLYPGGSRDAVPGGDPWGEAEDIKYPLEWLERLRSAAGWRLFATASLLMDGKGLAGRDGKGLEYATRTAMTGACRARVAADAEADTFVAQVARHAASGATPFDPFTNRDGAAHIAAAATGDDVPMDFEGWLAAMRVLRNHMDERFGCPWVSWMFFHGRISNGDASVLPALLRKWRKEDAPCGGNELSMEMEEMMGSAVPAPPLPDEAAFKDGAARLAEECVELARRSDGTVWMRDLEDWLARFRTWFDGLYPGVPKDDVLVNFARPVSQVAHMTSHYLSLHPQRAVDELCKTYGVDARNADSVPQDLADMLWERLSSAPAGEWTRDVRQELACLAERVLGTRWKVMLACPEAAESGSDGRSCLGTKWLDIKALYTLRELHTFRPVPGGGVGAVHTRAVCELAEALLDRQASLRELWNPCAVTRPTRDRRSTLVITRKRPKDIGEVLRPRSGPYGADLAVTATVGHPWRPVRLAHKHPHGDPGQYRQVHHLANAIGRRGGKVSEASVASEAAERLHSVDGGGAALAARLAGDGSPEGWRLLFTLAARTFGSGSAMDGSWVRDCDAAADAVRRERDVVLPRLAQLHHAYTMVSAHSAEEAFKPFHPFSDKAAAARVAEAAGCRQCDHRSHESSFIKSMCALRDAFDRHFGCPWVSWAFFNGYLPLGLAEDAAHDVASAGYTEAAAETERKALSKCVGAALADAGRGNIRPRGSASVATRGGGEVWNILEMEAPATRSGEHDATALRDDTPIPDKPFELRGRRELNEFFNEEVVDVLRRREKYARFGIGFPEPFILEGPPGCGKTYAVERLAEYLEYPVFRITSSSVGSEYVHKTAKLIEEMFAEAAEQAPSVLIVDEMDAFMPDRARLQHADSHHVEEVSSFLKCLQTASEKHILVAAMTNLIKNVDPAILRTGRFGRHLSVQMPDEEEVKEVLAFEVEKRPHADFDLTPFARRLLDRPLSDVTQCVVEASKIAVRRDAERLEAQDIEGGIDKLDRLVAKAGETRAIGFAG